MVNKLLNADQCIAFVKNRHLQKEILTSVLGYSKIIARQIILAMD